jgi:hypothetical protein
LSGNQKIALNFTRQTVDSGSRAEKSESRNQIFFGSIITAKDQKQKDRRRQLKSPLDIAD